MFKIAIAAGVMLAPAMVLAQAGTGMGTNAYAQPHSPEGDMASGAAGTATHKAQMKHAQPHHAMKKSMHSSSMHSSSMHSSMRASPKDGTTSDAMTPGAATPR